MFDQLVKAILTTNLVTIGKFSEMEFELSGITHITCCIFEEILVK
jgi:hypothetical protein